MSDDRGSAIVDFALVAGLLSVVFVSVLQFGLVLFVRNTLTDCASQGARYGARSGRAPAEGAQRARTLVASELSQDYAARIIDVSAQTVDVGGTRVVEVRLSAPLPVIGLLGPAGRLTVSGHAYAEEQ